MLKDGSQAWEVKDFLVQQDRCEVVTIEGKDYPGKGSAQVLLLLLPLPLLLPYQYLAA